MGLSFPEWLRGRRAVLRVKQKDLAARLGVSPHTVSRWEAGTSAIRSVYIAPLARWAGVEPGMILEMLGR